MQGFTQWKANQLALKAAIRTANELYWLNKYRYKDIALRLKCKSENVQFLIYDTEEEYLEQEELEFETLPRRYTKYITKHPTAKSKELV